MLSDIPRFFVYGEPVRSLDVGFLHVETVMARRSLHFGRVAPHRHDAMAQVTFWTKGRGDYLIDEALLPFEAPAASFVPSGVVHGFTVEADATDAIVVSIADGALASIADLCGLPLGAPVMIRAAGEREAWESLSAIMGLILRSYADAPGGSQGVTLPLVAAALAQMSRLARAEPALAASPQTLLAARFRQLVEARFRENWTVTRYVEALGTTPYLLARACEASLGAQAKDVIGERRFLEAKRLLVFTIRPVEDIAFELGMRDAAYFSRFFRARAGLPPGEWRRRRAA